MISAIYTASLFPQAKPRDLWQSPLLPPQLLVQAVASGAAALLLLAAVVEPALVRPLAGVALSATLLHLLLVGGEATITHATAHARLAALEMTRGRYGRFFQAGIVFQAAGVLVGLAFPGSVLAAPLVLAGLLAYEHAFVQAGQAV